MVLFLKIEGKEVAFSLRQSKLSKHLRITVFGNGRISVSAPQYVSQKKIFEFVLSRTGWIAERLKEAALQPVVPRAPRHSAKEIAGYKRQARTLVEQRILVLNASYGFRYGRISIRNQKSRWGSCSKKGNLNFNYRIALLPSEYADYIIVHELCHLKEFNHSKQFWDLVAIAAPNYKRIRSDLRKGAGPSSLL